MRLRTSGACAGLFLCASMAAAQPAPAVTFTDVTQAAGLRFRHTNGAFGKKYLPETMGAGGAFLDYDGDGWQDIVLINGMDWPWPAPGRGPKPGRASARPRQRATLQLYRNNRDGTFTDVTRAAGLDV